MANRCPSCGGTLRFDIQKQKLVCEYCMSEFDTSSMPQMGGANESQAFGQEPAQEEGGDTIDAKIFTCPNCGAEVFATDLDAVEPSCRNRRTSCPSPSPRKSAWSSTRRSSSPPATCQRT